MLRILILSCCCLGLAFGASSDKKIESAIAKFEAEINKANESYNKDVAKAKEGLEKVFKKAIASHRKKGNDEAAEALATKLKALTTEKAQEKEVKVAVKGHEALLSAIGKVAVNKEKQNVSTAKTIGDKKHVFLYFSAHWCPPCKMFTPRLVDFYNNNGGGEKFEIIFVSSDRDEASMYGYMNEAKMPWLSVPFSQIQASGLKTTYGGRGIPNLVLLDNQGKVLSGSYQNGQYVGPDQALRDYATLK